MSTIKSATLDNSASSLSDSVFRPTGGWSRNRANGCLRSLVTVSSARRAATATVRDL